MRSLYADKKEEQLADTLSIFGADITALQEMRWIGNGISQNRDFDIYFSCHEKHHLLGVGFLVGKKLKDSVIGFNNISDRLCTLRLRSRFYNISIINVHCHTEDSNDQEKDNFFDQIENAVNACPRHDVKIVLGDFNAKIGRQPEYRQITGAHSLHELSNDNGQRTIELAASLNMVVASTRFPRKDIHKWTWTSPDGVTRNQIDHVLINNRYLSCLSHVRSYRGANCDSDHFLVGAAFRARIGSKKIDLKGRSVKINTEENHLL